MGSRSKDNAECCPACGRPFKGVADYPRIRIVAFQRLPIPEAVDQMSSAAAERRLTRMRNQTESAGLRRDDGINMTPKIAEACARPDVQAYFDQLASLVNQEVEPAAFSPPMPQYGIFRWAHRIGDTGLCLVLNDVEAGANGDRVAQVVIYCDGPNMGSVGGPTLQELGPVARIRYRGVLNTTRQ